MEQGSTIEELMVSLHYGTTFVLVFSYLGPGNHSHASFPYPKNHMLTFLICRQEKSIPTPTDISQKIAA